VDHGPPAALDEVDSSLPLPEAIAHLAARQHGHVARRQLIALGVATSTIDNRVARRDLIVAHHGVYAVAYRREDPAALACAAVLACGPTAVLSHDSAAALWGLRRWPRTPEVIAPRVRRPGIKAHRSSTLTARQTTTQLGIRATTVARTLADIRRRLTQRQFTRVVNDARVRHLIGTEPAERLLGDGTHKGLTRSELEDAFARLVDDYDLPSPQTNVKVNGVEADVWFAEARLIVELDGWDTHRDRATFESDRERDANHLAAGVLTIRVTEERLRTQPAREAARLREILDARS
jgi:very-short-patch-repair endonuclease